MSRFDLSEMLNELYRFLRTAPQFLRQNHCTYQYATGMERLSVGDDSPFTMAVVGQMRTGKSTLINAMIGSDEVALVGVNETTATVNWIRYGSAADQQKFRVVWDRQPPVVEEFPKTEIVRWSGDSQLAQATRYLEFYSPAEFLKRVSVVDTPGSRSTIEQHQATLESFLAARQKCEDETLYYGGQADCLVYVLPVVARQSDSDLLSMFARETRIPGSSVFNSVGVLHKWEAMINSPRPWIEAQGKVETLRKQLRRYVSDVLLVSGPLHHVSLRTPLEFWQQLLRLSRGVSDSAFQLLTLKEQYFLRTSLNQDPSQLGLIASPEARSSLYRQSELPWPCFKVLMQFVRNSSETQAARVCTEVRDLAGVDRLLELLETRFFNRTKVIRATTLLGKALSPCDLAVRELKIQKSLLLDKAFAMYQARQEVTALGKVSEHTDGFLRTLQSEWERGTHLFELAIRNLQAASREVRSRFLSFDRDLRAIRILDEHPNLFEDDESIEMMYVLGAYGFEPEQRCARYDNWSDDPQQLEARLSHWVARAEASLGMRQSVLLQVVERLEELLSEQFAGHYDAVP